MHAVFSDLQWLTVSLPEDVAKLKWFGDFERAQKVIDLSLERNLPEGLKKRLLLEKEILHRMPQAYPHTREQALEILRGALRDFRDEELDALQDANAVEWIFRHGVVHYKDNFLENLLKTRQAYADRVKDPALTAQNHANLELLNRTIATMKRKKSLGYRFRLRCELSLSPSCEREGETIRVHLPLPVEYAQVRNFRLVTADPTPTLVGRPDHPHRTIFFETPLRARQKFSVEYEFENVVHYQRPDPAGVTGAQPTFYTEEHLPHVWLTPYMKSLAAEITAGCEGNPLRKARSIYDYITSHVMYSFVRPYLTLGLIPEYVATGFKGDCGVQAILFITLCRAAGIPARWQAGQYCTPLDVSSHDWAQFYVAPYGWLFADCSFGGSARRRGDTERWDFYFGNLDPFRIPLCSEFQHDLDPASRFTRHDPYDNQIGEVEYADLALAGDEFHTQYTLLSAQEIQ